MSRDDDIRIHRLIRSLLDQPAPDRQRWLAEALPDRPDLRAQLMAAIGSGGRSEVGDVAFALEAAGPEHSAMPARIGRYEIRDRLGSGRMGALYLAVDPVLGRRVAVRLLRFRADEMHERFMREAQAIARLNHRNVVTIFTVGEHEGHPFLAMEYVAGDTLEKLIQRRPSWSVAEKVWLIVDLCDGLACAHEAGVIHGDVRPSNVMVTPQGTLKISDFGIARRVDSVITRAGDFVGSTLYMSPEQREGRAADQLSDMFSVGLVLYELLSWQRAFPGDTPRLLSELIPEFDPDLDRVVARALRHAPQDRYPDLTAMRADLLRVATRLESVSPGLASAKIASEQGPPPFETVTARRLSRRFPPALVATCVGGIVAIAITIAATVSLQPADEPVTSERDAPPSDSSADAVPRAGPDAVAQPQPAAVGPTAPDARGLAATAQTSSSSPSPAGGQVAALLKQAETLRLRREYEEAIAQYFEVLRLAPGDDTARAGLRETLAVKQRSDEALEKLAGSSASSTRASAAEAEAERLVTLALEAMAASDGATARRALEDALRVNPVNESARNLLKILTGR